MKAKALLEGSLGGYSVPTATAMRQALDLAWSMVATGYTGSPATDKARMLLAECILAVTSHAETDVNKIVGLALTMFHAEERRRRQP